MVVGGWWEHCSISYQPPTTNSLLLHRIFRPGGFRIAPAHFLAHLFVRTGPEAAQVARDLYGPSGGREDLERDRRFAPADPRRVGEAEEPLQPRRRDDRSVVPILESHTAP